MSRKRYLFFALNIFLPLNIGFLFYYLYQESTYINEIFPLNKNFAYANSLVCYIMLNWGCDFLWAYAWFFPLYWSTGNYKKTIIIATSSICVLESLQLIRIEGLKCGTFYFYDILVEIVGVVVATLVTKLFKKRGEK